MIRLNHVNKYYNKGRQNEIHVINDVNLELPSTGMVAFFGKSGCGKTTLLNAIGGLDRFADGSIEIEGENIRKNPDVLRNRYMGYIFQNYNLNMLVNIYENVAEALRLCGMTDEEEIGRRVNIALKNVGMEKYVQRMPDTLSGGQKQRIAIARAIVKNPPIILADEPTGNLDEKNTIMIMDLLKSISKDHLVLLVTHESNLVDFYCDQVVELRDGQIINVRENSNANGYVAREKNVVYLGEMSKRQLYSDDDVNISYYGDPTPEKLDIRLVNRNGVLMLTINPSKVKLVDENSEILFHEGVYEEVRQKQEERTDMTELPTITGDHFGRLFTWKNSMKESFELLTRKGRKSNKALRWVMVFFAFLITVVVTIFAQNVEKMLQAREANNRNTFYTFARNKSKVAMLYEALEQGLYGIDYVEDTTRIPRDVEIALQENIFETFIYDIRTYGNMTMNLKYSPILAHGVVLPHKLIKDPKVLCGKASDLQENEIVITSEVAEIFLKNVKMGFVKSPEDLLGFSVKGFEKSRVVGIIESDEPAIYVDYQYIFGGRDIDRYFTDGGEEISPNQVYEVGRGEVVYQVDTDVTPNYQEGDTVTLGGKQYTIRKVIFTEGETLEDYLNHVYNVNGKVVGFVRKADRYVVTMQNESGETVDLDIGIGEFERHTEYCPESFFMHNSDYMEMIIYMERLKTEAYLMVHTTDPEATEAFLKANYLEGTGYLAGAYELITPKDLYDRAMSPIKNTIKGSLIVTSVVSLLLCLCMYMIMRSGLMARIKEIGVYRCIGVTRRNLNFKFAVEAFVLTSISVLPGYLFVMGILEYINYGSALDFKVFTPIWIFLPLLGLLYLACILCGILPTILLLRKTPSEIIAKYDV